jgi:predicted dehydrogenase
MPTLNVALIGYGYAGRTLHAPLLAHTPGLRLAAIVSSKAEQVAAEWPEATRYADPEALFADKTIDLVVIATPNDSHVPLARQALQAGKHVVVDKPFTPTLAEARELEAVAQRCGKVLSVFQNRRWDADYLTLKAAIEAGTLGRVVHFESHYDRYRPKVLPRWREQPGAGSGLWYDLGPHLVDQALQLFGLPDTVFADLAAMREGALATDYFHVQLRYADKRVILHGANLVSGGVPRFTVHGTQSSYVKFGLDTQEADLKKGRLPGGEGWGCDPLPGTLFTRGENDSECSRPVPNLDGEYRRYYEAIHAAIADGAANPVTPAEAIGVMAVIETAVASSAAGAALALEPQGEQQ